MVNNNMFVLDGCAYQGTTNVRKLKNVLFSIREQQYVKPIRRLGDRVSGWWEYLVAPGYYYRVSYDEWNKRDPKIILIVEIIDLQQEDGKIDVVKKVVIEANSKSELLELLKRFELEILEDFLKIVPGYHQVPGILDLAKNKYKECTVFNLFSFLNTYNGKTIRDND